MKDYLDFHVTGDLVLDVHKYYSKYSRIDTYEHTLDVVNELYYMKKLFGFIESDSEIACYCHDLGRVVSSEEILDFCYKNKIMVTEEEKKLPSVLHQKISCFIAEKIFKITDATTLNAIKYHTTLRKYPSMTEIEVYLADKMSWKEGEYRELVRNMKDTLKQSKENAVFYYLSDLHNKREKLKLYHSDSKDAYEYFKSLCS